MSNLRNRLKKTAIDQGAISTKIYMILEEAIREKAKEIGYDQNANFDFEETAVILDKNMGNNNTESMANQIAIAVEDWANEIRSAFPNELKK